MTNKNKKLGAFDILRAIGEIDDELLLECENYAVKPIYKRKSFIAAVSAAACFVFIITGAAVAVENYKSASFGSMAECADSNTSISETMQQSEMPGETENAVDENGSAENYDLTESSTDEYDVILEEAVEAPTEECEAAEEEIIESVVESAPTLELEKITIPESFSGDMGFEGLMYYGGDDFYSNHAVSVVSAETMPVYRNLSSDKYGRAHGMTYDELEEKFNSLAEYFDMSDCDRIEIRFGENDMGIDPDYVHSISSNNAEGVSLSVKADGSWSVIFDEKVPSPCDSEEETSLYFAEKYGELFDFDSPECYVFADRDIYGELNYHNWVYEKGADEVESLVNRSYCGVTVIIYGDGSFGGFHVSGGLDYSEKLGDYPIITESEALEALLDGNYITTVPVDYLENGIIAKENVLCAETVYRDSMAEEYFIPYYRFWVKLSGINEGELTTYGAFYVPALEREYIANYEIFDGSFN